MYCTCTLPLSDTSDGKGRHVTPLPSEEGQTAQQSGPDLRSLDW